MMKYLNNILVVGKLSEFKEGKLSEFEAIPLDEIAAAMAQYKEQDPSGKELPEPLQYDIREYLLQDQAYYNNNGHDGNVAFYYNAATDESSILWDRSHEVNSYFNNLVEVHGEYSDGSRIISRLNDHSFGLHCPDNTVVTGGYEHDPIVRAYISNSEVKYFFESIECIFSEALPYSKWTTDDGEHSVYFPLTRHKNHKLLIKHFNDLDYYLPVDDKRYYSCGITQLDARSNLVHMISSDQIEIYFKNNQKQAITLDVVGLGELNSPSETFSIDLSKIRYRNQPCYELQKDSCNNIVMVFESNMIYIDTHARETFYFNVDRDNVVSTKEQRSY